MIRIIRVGNAERFLKARRRRGGGGGGAKDRPGNGRIVASIIDDVRRNGDAAIKKYEKRFGAARTITSLRVSKREIDTAYSAVQEREIAAVKLAGSRLAKTEAALMRRLREVTVSSGGTRISRSFVPLDSVGCYVPGGGARYPSSAIMSIVPARVAGVGRIVAVSPPATPSGGMDPLTVVAADLCGATEIYRTGGAQSVAALAFGTRSIGRVDKIVGPGGAFVTAAKHQVSGVTPVDMTAGPTELGIIVDSADDADLAALDLISQAEHSADTTCYAMTTSMATAKRIRSCVASRLAGIRRSGVVRSSLDSNGFIAVCRPADIIRISNELAPEHLEILSDKPERWDKIRGPGLILAGRDSPSAASDYMLGSNHILPTGGTGRARGPLSVLDFVKLLTRVETTGRELRRVSGHVRSLAMAEGLPNHYEAVGGRLR